MLTDAAVCFVVKSGKIAFSSYARLTFTLFSKYCFNTEGRHISLCGLVKIVLQKFSFVEVQCRKQTTNIYLLGDKLL